jgi:uncharacterized RDD family membrane protein YckC
MEMPPQPEQPRPDQPAAPPPPPAGPQAPGGPQAPASQAPAGGWEQPIPQQAPGWHGLPLASWGTRLGAYLIDVLIVSIPGLIVFFAVIAGAIGLTGDDSDAGFWAAIGASLLATLLFAAIALLYAATTMARKGQANGQTWGKQLLNIRVVRDSGEPMTFWWAALREVGLKWIAVGVASSIIPFIPWFLNYFWPLWDDQNRCLHDMVASTHVVRA